MMRIAPRWPPGPVGFLALFGFAAGILTANVPSVRVGPFLWLYRLAIFIFRSHKVYAAVMNLAALAHVVEAVIMAGKNRRMGNSLANTCGWVAMTLLIGYPSMQSFQAEAARQRSDTTPKDRKQ